MLICIHEQRTSSDRQKSVRARNLIYPQERRVTERRAPISSVIAAAGWSGEEVTLLYRRGSDGTSATTAHAAMGAACKKEVPSAAPPRIGLKRLHLLRPTFAPFSEPSHAGAHARSLPACQVTQSPVMADSSGRSRQLRSGSSTAPTEAWAFNSFASSAASGPSTAPLGPSSEGASLAAFHDCTARQAAAGSDGIAFLRMPPV